MYVLVRADLSPGAQLAQVGHAAAEYAALSPVILRQNPTIVVLAVRDESELLDWHQRVSDVHVLFRDPDYGDAGEHTALAVVSNGREFSALPLAGAAMV